MRKKRFPVFTAKDNRPKRMERQSINWEAKFYELAGELEQHYTTAKILAALHHENSEYNQVMEFIPEAMPARDISRIERNYKHKVQRIAGTLKRKIKDEDE